MPICAVADACRERCAICYAIIFTPLMLPPIFMLVIDFIAAAIDAATMLFAHAYAMPCCYH